MVEFHKIFDLNRCRIYLSDMKTFTVRDLDRNPKAVLEASKAEGTALIRSRDGSRFVLTPILSSRDQSAGWLIAHKAWLSTQGSVVGDDVVAEVDRLVSGE